MSNFTLDEFQHAGCTVRIESDDLTDMNPRTEYDNVGTMVCFHTRYNLGDKDAVEQLHRDFAKTGLYKDAWDNPNSVNYRDMDDPGEMYRTAIDCNFIVLPLYLYDHSGITMNTGGFSCPWDSGQVGFIYCPPWRAAKEWGKKLCTARVREQAKSCLESEVETYDCYIKGEVWGFVVEHEESGREDSCWGFIEDYPHTYVIGQAKEAAESLERAWRETEAEHERDRQRRLCDLIRNRVPLETRAREMRSWA